MEYIISHETLVSSLRRELSFYFPEDGEVMLALKSVQDTLKADSGSVLSGAAHSDAALHGIPRMEVRTNGFKEAGDLSTVRRNRIWKRRFQTTASSPQMRKKHLCVRE